jgi:hypothetical protein
MIVYGVTADVSIAQLFIAGVLPGLLLAAAVLGLPDGLGAAPPGQVPPADRAMSWAQAARIAPPDPGGAADRCGAGQHLQRRRHRHRGRGVGVVGALAASRRRRAR